MQSTGRKQPGHSEQEHNATAIPSRGEEVGVVHWVSVLHGVIDLQVLDNKVIWVQSVLPSTNLTSRDVFGGHLKPEVVE